VNSDPSIVVAVIFHIPAIGEIFHVRALLCLPLVYGINFLMDW
jgi:hypothetical protein